jgi:hypothetical protein
LGTIVGEHLARHIRDVIIKKTHLKDTMGTIETQELWGTIWGTNLTKKMWDKIKVQIVKNNPEHHWGDSLEILLGILLGNRTSKPQTILNLPPYSTLDPVGPPHPGKKERKKEKTSLVAYQIFPFLKCVQHPFLPWLNKYPVFDSRHLFSPCLSYFPSRLYLWYFGWKLLTKGGWTPTSKRFTY